MCLKTTLLACLITMVGASGLISQEPSEADQQKAYKSLALGQLQWSLGNHDEAINYFREAARLNPTGQKELRAIINALIVRAQRDVLHVWAFSGDLKKDITDNQELIETIVRTPIPSAILTGLPWLARHQVDSHWSADGFTTGCKKDGSPTCDGAGRKDSDIYSTSLALLAFTGAGYTHLSRDNYDGVLLGGVVKRALLWLIRNQRSDGLFVEGKGEQVVRDQALATLAMNEVHRNQSSTSLKQPLEKAFECLLNNRIQGKGWALKGKEGDCDPVATAWALLALRSGHETGLASAGEAMKEAQAWLESYVRESKARADKRDATAAFAFAVCRILDPKVAEENTKAWREGIAKTPPGMDPDQREAAFAFAGSLALLGDDPKGALWTAWCEKIKTSVGGTRRLYDFKLECPSGSWDPVGPSDSPRGRLLNTVLYTLSQEIRYRYNNGFWNLTRPAAVPPQPQENR